MNDAGSLRAIPGPADAVLPQAAGAWLGVLMLDTRFPRPPGDIGHPATFRGPVRHRVVPGAVPGDVVRSAEGLRAGGIAHRFIDAALALQAEGAAAITTSCGFLVLLQDQLQAALRVPVVASSLLQLPALLARERRVGVLTISAEHLVPDYLLASGVPADRVADVVVQGVAAQGPFARALLGNQDALDPAAAERDVVDAAEALQRRAPGLRSVVLECTNMPPYAAAVQRATGWRLCSLATAPVLRPWFAA